ncbi:MAG: hypothetical protein CBARDMAM_1234 [uncultured Caballeronia sp.]|nr:MAG: hypothetical protein CBARDMAM_1234 [uncultured Caballeronia sp.]
MADLIETGSKARWAMRCTPVPYGAGHNLRMILGKLRLFYAFMLTLLLNPAARV